MSWDQRIPNEPILERQFLIERPPIIPQDFPRNTSQCISGQNRPWLNMTIDTEHKMMDYWRRHIDNGQEPKSLPDRPWLHGIHRRIDCDTLLSRSYYNPKDCILRSGPIEKATPAKLPGNDDALCQLWNQPTSVRMIYQ